MAVNISGDTGIDKITDGSIVTADFASGAITGSILPAGSILQVVQDTKTDTFTTSSTSFVDVTGLSVSITPSSTSSKILVLVDISVGTASSGYSIYNLVKDSTDLYQGTEAKTYVGSHIEYFGSASYIGTLHMCYLDSPSTTSSTTYKIQVRATSGTACVNRRGTADDTSLASSITVMEVAG